jgi:hypothetical protein
MNKIHVLECGNGRRMGPYQGADWARLTHAHLPDRQAGREARPGFPAGPKLGTKDKDEPYG